MTKLRGFRDDGPVIGYRTVDGKHQFLLENQRWYTYNRNTPNRYRRPFPNLDGEIVALLRNEPNLNKESIYSRLLRKGMSRYVLDKEAVSEKIDTLGVRVFAQADPNCAHMPLPVCQAFRSGLRAVTYRHIRFEYDKGEGGVAMIVYARCSGVARISGGGQGEVVTWPFENYIVKKLVERERFVNNRNQAEAELVEIFKTQCKNIVKWEMSKHPDYRNAIEEVGSELPGMEIYPFSYQIFKVVY